MELSGAEIVVQFLKDEGVEHVFGYPGGAVLHIYDALFKDCKVPHVLVRHEQAATHAADGYARATGKVGVAVTVTIDRQVRTLDEKALVWGREKVLSTTTEHVGTATQKFAIHVQ